MGRGVTHVGLFLWPKLGSYFEPRQVETVEVCRRRGRGFCGSIHGPPASGRGQDIERRRDGQVGGEVISGDGARGSRTGWGPRAGTAVPPPLPNLPCLTVPNVHDMVRPAHPGMGCWLGKRGWLARRVGLYVNIETIQVSCLRSLKVLQIPKYSTGDTK